ncbi:MAG: LCP family protein [Bacilli bacterium]|nr:LCP family protein [Bacilli bacterium]
MKLNKIFKFLISSVLLIVQIISFSFFSYSLILYKGVETFYRYYGIAILLYLLLFMSYLLFRGIKKKNWTGFIVSAIVTILIIGVEAFGYYYLNKIYKSIDSYSENTNEYYSVLVTYNKSYNSYKDLNNKTIGIVNDKKDIEGNILPNEIINELQLSDNNTIKEYTSTMELLYELKNNEIDAAFFSRNYIDMFSSLEGYEDIEDETKVLYEKSKIYDSNEEDIKDANATLTKPFTMLLIGVDSSKDGVTSGYNGDVLLLVTFNPKTLRASLTSVPRDTYLKTACSNGNYRRINTTTWGSSSACAVKTIENLFGVNINYYAKINFKGVVQLVEAVGGIDIDVPYSICEQNSSRSWGNNTVFVEKGKQHLNGEQALALSRNRHKPNDGSNPGKKMAQYCPTYTDGSRSDYTRGKIQMKVILGIIKAATKMTDPNQAIDILTTIKPNFQTNIKTNDVLSLYGLGKSIIINDSANLVNIQRMQLKGYGVYKYVYDPSSKSYPAVTIPYKGSINDIKKEININLGKSKATLVKKASFDLNNLYQDIVVGQGSYSESRISVLKSMSGYSVDQIKNYARSNGLTLKFIDIDTNETLSLNNFNEYSFHSQKEHKDTILELVKTLTIYVKKKDIQ